jgi:hypothetical protein
MVVIAKSLSLNKIQLPKIKAEKILAQISTGARNIHYCIVVLGLLSEICELLTKHCKCEDLWRFEDPVRRKWDYNI